MLHSLVVASHTNSGLGYDACAHGTVANFMQTEASNAVRFHSYVEYKSKTDNTKQKHARRNRQVGGYRGNVGRENG